jgi:arylsulfatase A-like enzyme
LEPASLNLVIVTLDTTRADRLGAYGYARALTPALDALAARGTLFEQALTSSPMTLPRTPRCSLDWSPRSMGS